jgi:pantoate--beta-alanine ligase
MRLTDPAELRRHGERIRASGLTLGLVPTMGALHQGHRSLIRRSLAECDRTAISIFVNPTQFGAGEDYERYPRALAADLALCAAEGVDIVYTPEVASVYPDGAATRVRVSGRLTETLEGARRPGHFEGVATVVAKLLIAARPDRAYFGHKDSQQCAVVRRLAADLDTGTEIVVCPTVRDPDGLALSSRNAYLSEEGRHQALAIPAALAAAAARHRAGEEDTRELVREAQRVLAASPKLSVDYVAAVDPDSLEPRLEVGRRCEIIIAARMGSTRLIDVVTLGADGGLGVDDRPPVSPYVP